VRFDRHELAGAFADVGVLVPIAVALIVKNGLSPTAVLLPAALLYLVVAAVYRLPVPVQPLKALGAIAIAQGLGADSIAAAALLIGAIFLTLGQLGLLDLASRVFPRAIIRGVQLTVGLLFLKIAWKLVHDTPKSFVDHAHSAAWTVALALLVVVLALTLRRQPIALALVAVGAVVMATRSAHVDLGPSSLSFPSLDAHTFWVAFTVLALPQIPLSFANSCLAPADAARVYFGEERARRVRPGRLATTLGLANLFSGAISGMPVCHGAGGLTAHVKFGARTAGAPVVIGATLLLLALVVGSGLAALLGAFPVAILGGLLATAGILHIMLLRDLASARDWGLALLVGALGFYWNLAPAVAIGLALYGLSRGARALRPALASR
jgi:MFS superfamily sulfate permease-like transporter